MNLTVPTEWAVSWAEIASVFFFCVGAIWLVSGAYRRIMARFDHIDERFDQNTRRMDAMEKRNASADQKTEVLEKDQASMHTTVAVIASQITSFGKTLDRIDRNLEEVIKRETRK